ncbi:hypothetical protein C6W92_16515 [Roseovarius sp. A46]|uniref:DUF1403 family protein n=1 Tax=Roseovarius sp. A46 TaxID=2109331 RepID=UPI0010132DC9|nr:DUF1403 family protein [Roseovarius sp. A46]RXV58627.1 hypothetical protein C6W92_16515 [Roseovarius sp. A46]
MTHAPSECLNGLETIPGLPCWVRSEKLQDIENAAFMSGAALAHLQLVIGREDVPQALLRHRLAMQAAAVCVAHSGRPERIGDLRDALHLRRPDDLPGPAGEIALQWARVVKRPVTLQLLQRALPGCDSAAVSGWFDAGEGGPVMRAAATVETVLADRPRDETAALILADAVLARALGWAHLIPLLALHLAPRDLHKVGDDLRLACHRAVIAAATEVCRIVGDLSRRSARLQAVAPKLRAKGAGTAVKMLLDRDAISPAELADPMNGTDMSGRAARRFCDRLVSLGVLRELTGRDAFRLYGL